MRHALLACIVAGAVLCAGTTDAAVLTGRFGLSGYLWEKTESDSTETRHLQNTGTMSLKLAHIGGEDLTISTSLRGRYDSRNVGDNVDDYRVHHLMIKWRNVADRADLTGGRHRVYYPTGSIGIDGGSADVHVWRGLYLGGYYGLTVPFDGSLRLTEHDDGHAFGAMMRIQCKCFGRLIFAFAERRQARSYVVDGKTIPVNTLASQRFAIDLRRQLPRVGTMYGNLVYLWPTHQIGRAHLALRWQASPDIAVHGQIRYRRPDIDYNSIYWVFGPSRYYEGRLRFNIRINPIWTLNVGGTYVDLYDDNTQRFDIGISHRYFAVMIHGKAGGAGSTLGLTGSALYPINPKWTVRGGARYSSFEFEEDQEESNWETSFWGGVRWNWHPQGSIDLEGQFLSQDITTQTQFAGAESDFRLLARINWWFFHKLGS